MEFKLHWPLNKKAKDLNKNSSIKLRISVPKLIVHKLSLQIAYVEKIKLKLLFQIIIE